MDMYVTFTISHELYTLKNQNKTYYKKTTYIYGIIVYQSKTLYPYIKTNPLW